MPLPAWNKLYLSPRGIGLKLKLFDVEVNITLTLYKNLTIFLIVKAIQLKLEDPIPLLKISLIADNETTTTVMTNYGAEPPMPPVEED